MLAFKVDRGLLALRNRRGLLSCDVLKGHGFGGLLLAHTLHQVFSVCAYVDSAADLSSLLVISGLVCVGSEGGELGL